MYTILLTIIRIIITLAGIYMFFYTRRVIPNSFPKSRIVIPFALSVTLIILGINDPTSDIAISFMYITIASFAYGVFMQIAFHKKHIDSKIHYLIPIFIMAIFIAYGFFNAQDIKRTDYVIETDKMYDNESIVIAMFADTHLNSVFDSTHYTTALKEIEQIKPDILLLVGDIYEEATLIKDMNKFSSELGKLNFKYSTYYVYGNHDTGIYLRNPKHITEAIVKQSLEENGIIILKDETVLIDNMFYIVGRMDKTVDKKRADINDLVTNIDKSKFIIMLDHQPISLSESAEAGGDLILSGHTHNGQVFPLGIITRLRNHYDVVYGAKTLDNTTMIVTSGMGASESALRTEGISEYLIITIKGIKASSDYIE